MTRDGGTVILPPRPPVTISTERFVANLVLGQTPPGPGLHIATTGAISAKQRSVPFTVDLYEDLDGMPGQALRRGPLRSTMDLADAELRAWDGYSLEVFALLVPEDLPGTEGRLLWTMNWRDDGRAPGRALPVRQWARYGESPVCSELLWLPGDKERPAIRGDIEHAGRTDLTRARRGVGLLLRTSLLASVRTGMGRAGPRATSDEEAFEQAVTIGLEWLLDNPANGPNDFGRQQFAAKRCTGIDAANKWMTDKHFGIRQIRRELARRIGWPA